jgi:hypothetical protein
MNRKHPTAFQRFEQRLLIRTLVIFIAGGVAVAFVHYVLTPKLSPQGSAILLLATIALWLAASAYSSSKLRGRSETLAAYKRRAGFKEPPDDGV